MDIRTKLVFALVAVSLGSMVALGTIAYSASGDLLRETSVRQLEALAASKKDDLGKVVQAWQDRVHLIASRTHLRLRLEQYNARHDQADREEIDRIVADALQSVRRVRRLTVYDVHGHEVASSGNDLRETAATLPEDRAAAARGPTPAYEGLFPISGEPLEVQFLSRLELGDEAIGWIEVRLSAGELAEIAGDFIGLGETGEVLIVAPDPSGGVRVLHPTRHAPEISESTLRASPDDPAVRAARGEEGVFLEGAVDYRGQPVWAATRFLPELGWGIVVKFDTAEETRPTRELGRRLVRLALALSAFAVVVGVLLGFRFARPIHELARVADQIRAGEVGVRAKVRSHDEVGNLARTFNQMADALTNPGIRIADVQREVEKITGEAREPGLPADDGSGDDAIGDDDDPDDRPD